jgi:hypothetical protein
MNTIDIGPEQGPALLPVQRGQTWFEADFEAN